MTKVKEKITKHCSRYKVKLEKHPNKLASYYWMKMMKYPKDSRNQTWSVDRIHINIIQWNITLQVIYSF